MMRRVRPGGLQNIRVLTGVVVSRQTIQATVMGFVVGVALAFVVGWLSAEVWLLRAVEELCR